MKKILTTILSLIAMIIVFGIYDINTKNIKAAEFKKVNHNTIEMIGEIVPGDLWRFNSAIYELDNQDEFNLVLYSPGGSAQATFEIIEMMKDKNITTMVKGGEYCMSGCAVMWTFGKERYMYNGADIGFHVGSIHDIDYLKQLIDGHGVFGFQSIIQESFAYFIDFYSKLPVKDGEKLAFNIATKGYNSDNFFILSPMDVREIIGGKYIN